MTAASLGACGPTGLSARPPDTANVDSGLGPGDLFEVRVYGEEDLSNDYRVSEDGTIDFPLIGAVEVAGRQPDEVSRLLEQRLRDDGILVNPQVTLLMKERPSRAVTVSGAVRNPGNYPLTPGLTIVQAISLAGGFTDLANRDGTVVRRRVEGELRLYQAPVDAITRGAQEDFPMRPGDVVFVPERPL